MRFFFDTEFIEAGPKYPLVLLSIGIVADNGNELYLEVNDADLTQANDFVKRHVLPHMSAPHGMNDGSTKGTSPRVAMGALVYQWVMSQLPKNGRPEFWAYYADYDWVLFCQMFGSMMDLPKGWPMYCNDLVQLLHGKGINKDQLPAQTGVEHHALEDARWVKQAWEWHHMMYTGQGIG